MLEPDDQRGQGFTGIRLQTGSLQPKNVPRVSILENGITSVERRRIETHSLKVMANDETGIRLFSATEKDNTSSIPRIKMLIPYLLFQGKD